MIKHHLSFVKVSWATCLAYTVSAFIHPRFYFWIENDVYIPMLKWLSWCLSILETFGQILQSHFVALHKATLSSIGAYLIEQSACVAHERPCRWLEESNKVFSLASFFEVEEEKNNKRKWKKNKLKGMKNEGRTGGRK